jgi:hypothetical protein
MDLPDHVATGQTLTLSRPLDPLITERLERAGVVPVQPQASSARYQHISADTETLAWNRARDAEWHAAPAKLEALLRELAPAVFSDQPPPLAIGIDAALIALLAGEVDALTIGRFLRDWTRRTAYLESVARGDVRRDLDGHPVDTPDDRARCFAAILLGRQGGAS